MNSQTLLNKPQPKIRVVAKVSKIGSLVEVSTKARKSSTSLRKVFEKGSYQKRTQLSVLNRYKRRLDSIQNQNDKNASKKSKEKIKLPPIKKYLGSFFSAGTSNDPLKSIGALAAFNAFQKGAKGDILGALGPGLIAAGLIFGPDLLELGVKSAFKSATKKPKVTSSGQFRNPFRKKPDVTRSGQFRSPLRKGAKITGDVEGGMKIGKAFGRFGKAIIPGVGAAVGAIDATMRAQEGDVTGASIAGTSATLDALAAASAATGIGLPVAGLLSVASFALDVTNLVRDLSGASEKEAQKNKAKQPEKLQQKVEEQKKLVEKKVESGPLTFGKTLDRYEKVVNKFEDFSKGFIGGMGETLEQTQARSTKIENLIGDQDIIEEPGYEFTNYTAQYLTGDPDSPAYDEAHGTSSNYHDHIAFNDREMAIRAYQYLESKGLDVTEFEGFDSVGGHSRGSYHYSGLAFDVPGRQWGATGPIDERHYNGSRLVRKYLNEFFQQEKQNNPNLQTKNTSAQRKRNPTQTKSPTQIPTKSNQSFQNTGGYGKYATPSMQKSIPTPPKVATSSAPKRSIQYYPSYDPRGQMESTIVPYPVVQQSQPQMMQQESSIPSFMGGPSEQQVLNSFYKRVLLNTVA